ISLTTMSWNCLSLNVGFDLNTGRFVVHKSACLKVFVCFEVQEAVSAIVEGYEFLFVSLRASHCFVIDVFDAMRRLCGGDHTLSLGGRSRGLEHLRRIISYGPDV